jgi:DNA-binding response OmpR family regulator
MKIAVFENEYDTVEVAFRYLNKKYYNNTIIFENYPRSDSFQDVIKLADYDLIIIDLDLSSQSKLDGFGLIRKIEASFPEPHKILILTGQNLTENYHIENGLKIKYPVLEKPMNYNKLYKKFIALGIKNPTPN